MKRELVDAVLTSKPLRRHDSMTFEGTSHDTKDFVKSVIEFFFSGDF